MDTAAVISRHGSRTRIKTQLNDYLEKLNPGDALPPIRILAEMYKASPGRLNGILDDLAREGVIERRSRVGIFKAETMPEKKAAPYIDMVLSDYLTIAGNGSFFGEILECFPEEAAKYHQGARVHRLPYDKLIPKYGELLSRKDIKACILLAPDRIETVMMLSRTGIPFVCVSPRVELKFYDCHSIYPSPQLMELQLNHLWKLGHKRIAFLHKNSPADSNFNLLQRSETFYRMMAEKGYKVEPHWVNYASGNQEINTLHALESIFSTKPYPTAIIVNDNHLVTTYRFLVSRNMRIGKDVSVMGTDDLKCAALMHPAATTVSNSPYTILNMAINTLHKLNAGEKIEKDQYVPSKLIIRESTGPVSNQARIVT
jgi:DNA-binding LacI/PurR family transcriptional regulator